MKSNRKNRILSILGVILLFFICITIFAVSKYKDSAGQEREFSNPTLDIAYAVYKSEEYKDYEKFGIFYDTKTQLFYYNNKIIGYFYDEFSKDKYNKFTNETGEIGVQILRDNTYKIIDVKEVGMNKVGDPDLLEVETNGSIKDMPQGTVQYEQMDDDECINTKNWD